MVRSPRVTITSLTPIGTPASAPGSSPAAILASTASSGGQSPFRRESQIRVGLRILGFREGQSLTREFFGAKFFREQAGANGGDGMRSQRSSPALIARSPSEP